ncbi:hypothetical protein BH23ACT12_BH23ACT12_18370 [soil metagenome]
MKLRHLTSIGLVLALMAIAALPVTATAGLPGGKVQLWSPENSANTHRPSLAEAIEDAVSFDLITPLKGSYRKFVPEMKAANPDLVLLSYMNGTLSQSTEGDVYPDEWHLKDANGNRVVSESWGNYLMDPTSEGWITSRIAQATEFIEFSGYDGVIMDVMGTAPIGESYSSGVPINPVTGRPWTKAEWLDATSALAARVKSAVAPKIVFVNGLGSGPRYFNPEAASAKLLDGIDGGHAEAFLRNANEPISRYPTTKNWLKEIDMLVDVASRGKSVLTLTKVFADGTQTQKDAWHRYSLASFLMGAGEKTYFTFQYARNDDPTMTSPLWSTNVGSPLGDYFQLAGGAYQRNFANGISLVNPGPDAITVSLNGTYRTLEGSLVSSMTLLPNQGDVLIRVS